MQETRMAVVNGEKIPVLISDEKEALLAAKAAGGAIVGLWRAGQETGQLAAADYVMEDMEAATEEFLERVARRHLGLPWNICETKRLHIREMAKEDLGEVWQRNIGDGFETMDGLMAYTKHQYQFYEFGFWAVTEKASGKLVGVAGLRVPAEDVTEDRFAETSDRAFNDRFAETEEPVRKELEMLEEEHASEEQRENRLEVFRADGAVDAEDQAMVLELGYHIFSEYRRQGYALECCQGIMEYGIRELGVSQFEVRIARDNAASRQLAEKLGFHSMG